MSEPIHTEPGGEDVRGYGKYMPGSVIAVPGGKQCLTCTALKDALAEVERLQAIEFEHNGCEGLRERDNAHLLGRIEKVLDQRDALKARVAEPEREE